MIKDGDFFHDIAANAERLSQREMAPMDSLIRRCAQLHMEHITQNGDPFELTSSRPLDFGHWSAHKLESMTQYELKHGEAVAIGIALDCIYGYLKEFCSRDECIKVLNCIRDLGFEMYHDAFGIVNPSTGFPMVLDGLKEFQEHLGGQLTISMLSSIGRVFDVHHVDLEVYRFAIHVLREYVSNGTMYSHPATGT